MLTYNNLSDLHRVLLADYRHIGRTDKIPQLLRILADDGFTEQSAPPQTAETPAAADTADEAMQPPSTPVCPVNPTKVSLLIRPRGFGLSLAVEAIRDLLLSEPDPAVRVHPLVLTFEQLPQFPRSLSEYTAILMDRLLKLCWQHHLWINIAHYDHPKSVLALLIESLAERHDGRLVVMIDNYDVPVIGASFLPNDQERHDALDMYLDLLNVLRRLKDRLRWSLLTGHIKFALASRQSEGLPLVRDLSCRRDLDTMFGFTREEITENFADQIKTAASRLGLHEEEFLFNLNRCYGGFNFSDQLRPVFCPACVRRALNDAALYPYTAKGSYPFLSRTLRHDRVSLSWLLGRDGQDPLFTDSIPLFPSGKAVGSLLIQLGFATRTNVTNYDHPGYANWRYQFDVPNVDMDTTLKIISGEASPALADIPVTPVRVPVAADSLNPTGDKHESGTL